VSKEVTNWEDQLAEQAKAVAQLERPAVATISLRGGIMKYQDQAVPGNNLDVVVIGSSHERTYYEDDFDPDVPASPVCFSQSLSTCTEPHEKSVKPQNATCKGCPQDEWGSANRGKGKACKEIRKLVLMPLSSLDSEEAVGKSEFAVMRVPVTSVKNWSSYANQVASMYKRPPWAVQTNVAVSPHPKNQLEVKFDYKGLVPTNLLSALSNRNDDVAKILLTPYEPVEEREEPAPQPTGRKKKYS
jgi:hypothetical protein